MNVSVPESDSDELARFREAWKAELRQRSHSVSRTANGEDPASGEASNAHAVVSAAHQSSGSASSSKTLSSAVDTYRRAVEQEQMGELDVALRLYRQAFKMDPNVDKAYRKEEIMLERMGLLEVTHRKKPPAEVPLEELHIRPMPAIKGHVTGTLAEIVAKFPQQLIFEPEDQEQGVALGVLPDEVLVLILKGLHPAMVERFALVNRKARLLTLDAAIWRHFVQVTYVPPQIAHDRALEDVVNYYPVDYRRFYIEHPRLRLDGIYIAVCHYVRPGLSENPWVNISHLITYHRYLRFLPNGQVLSLLANDEVEPHSVVPLLKPTLRMKGFAVGLWKLLGHTVHVTDLMDPSGTASRYTFQMTLTLRSRPMGRWNKLEISGYDSVDCESGEAVPVALKHERPFWFSKVRSY
ncbi:hypothetical protein BD410DRAFT_786831 [Rickenella mellea]|uniref:F-box domain-containing protein n=1 Tax=Rickenella mellea TaxID=50990 RepID=A0A4Y7Q9Q3_9AGAM|nr:hypothetical protein BD410DRAFT_786831 [Rickenella mellea]